MLSIGICNIAMNNGFLIIIFSYLYRKDNISSLMLLKGNPYI